MLKKSIIQMNLAIICFSLFIVTNANAYSDCRSIRLVHQAYQQILKRSPYHHEVIRDSSRLRNGWTAKRLVRELVNCNEHIQKFYRCPRQYVNILYRHLLARNAESGGLNHWTRKFKSLKRSYGRWTACKKITRFIYDSPEYMQKFGNHRVPH